MALPNFQIHKDWKEKEKYFFPSKILAESNI